MFARNLLGAVVVALFASMFYSCFTTGSADAEPVAQTALPLETSVRTVAVQNVVTDLAAKVNMVSTTRSFIAAN